MKIRLCQKLIKDFQLVQPSLKSVKEKRLRVFPASPELSVGSELKCWKLSFWHIQSSYLEIFYSTSPTFEILRFHYLNLSISIYQSSKIWNFFCSLFALAEKLGWQKLWSQIKWSPCLQTVLSYSTIQPYRWPVVFASSARAALFAALALLSNHVRRAT